MCVILHILTKSIVCCIFVLQLLVYAADKIKNKPLEESAQQHIDDINPSTSNQASDVAQTNHTSPQGNQSNTTDRVNDEDRPRKKRKYTMTNDLNIRNYGNNILACPKTQLSRRKLATLDLVNASQCKGNVGGGDKACDVTLDWKDVLDAMKMKTVCNRADNVCASVYEYVCHGNNCIVISGHA